LIAASPHSSVSVHRVIPPCSIAGAKPPRQFFQFMQLFYHPPASSQFNTGYWLAGPNEEAIL
jgi:hypothetical protein